MRNIQRLLLAVLLSASGVLAAGGPAAATTAPGTVLTSTTATLPSELAALATGKRIRYVTTDLRGDLIPVTGLIITPTANKKNKVVVWGHGTTGLADQCTPSTNQNVFWPEARTAVAALLTRGFTVAAPDYPGLGTVQQHPYLIGGADARAMIDSVRAARNLDAALGLRYVLDGHSQGGQGSLFANQIAPAYDGALVLRGSAAIAPVSNVDVLAPAIPGTPGQGYLVMALYGLATVTPGFSPATVLAAPARLKSPVLVSGCLNEILATYQDFTPQQLLVGGALPASVVARLGHFDNPAQTPPSAPILIVQGTDDAAVPYDVTHDLLLPELGTSQPVQFYPVAGATHDTSVILSADYVANWISDRFR